MPFLVYSNEFTELEKLTWGFYIVAEVLPTTSRIKLINKREFAKVALKINSETFVVYIATLEVLTVIHIYLSKTSQI